jgi:hypothetical protein
LKHGVLDLSGLYFLFWHSPQTKWRDSQEYSLSIPSAIAQSEQQLYIVFVFFVSSRELGILLIKKLFFGVLDSSIELILAEIGSSLFFESQFEELNNKSLHL